MPEPTRYTLSSDDVILRGCGHEPPRRLLESMRAHRAMPRKGAEWGLSVAAMPGQTEDGILESARQIRQSHYRVASVRSIHGLGGDLLTMPPEQWAMLDMLSVTWDHNAHGLILSGKEPTLELAARLAAVFGPPKVNPFYSERSRRGIHR